MDRPNHVSGVGYLLTFVALLAFATLSLFVSFLHWPRADLPLSLIIAGIKALLVLCFFMHLIEQRFTNRLTVLVSVGFAVLLISLTAADVASRDTMPAQVQPPETERFYVR
jgi:cytochrome c oxidase subunit IV